MIAKQPSKTKHLSFRFLIPVLLVVIFSRVSSAQEADTIVPLRTNPEKLLRRMDISDITRNGLRPWEIKFSGHFAGIDFGFNTFFNEDYSAYESEFLENDIFRSNSAYFNVFQQSFGLQRQKNTWGLVSGLGFQLQSFRMNDKTTIVLDENEVVLPEFLYFDSNQKSKLANVWLHVPLLMEWQIPVNHYDNRIYISAGLIAAWRLNSHTKIKYKASERQKHKVVGDFSMNTFRYSLMMRAGYRWFNFFASYDLVPLFEDDKGPELTPFTIGVTLLRF